jgi:ubiquinone/menaquinone biosynthesis C-methylase UbiE
MTYHNGNQLIDAHIVIEKAHIVAGMHVADLGCGSAGHIVFPTSKVVGDRGVVYAVDILKTVLSLVEKRAKVENIINIHTVWSDIERDHGVLVPEKTVDVVLLVNVLFHMSESAPTLDESARILKNKGRIVVVDWKDTGFPIAPKKESLVDFDSIKSWAREHNFVVQEDFDMGNHHRGVVLYRHD